MKIVNKKQKEEKSKTKNKYYKHPQYGMVFGPDVVVPLGRLAWPYLVTPREGMEDANGNKGAPRYEVTLILPKNDPKVIAFHDIVADMVDEMVTLFNDKRPAKIAIDDIFKDGDKFDSEKYPYYQGSHVLVARNTEVPETKDITKNSVGKYTPKNASEFVGGLLCVAIVAPLITSYGVSYKLKTIISVRDDGIRIGGSVASAESLIDDSDILSGLTEGIEGIVDEEDMTLEEAASRI